MRVHLRDSVLVSNRSSTTSTSSIVANRVTTAQAQAFTTGAHSGGYELKTLGVELAAPSGTVTAVAIHSDNKGSPGAILQALDNPPTIPTSTTGSDFAGTNLFLAPEATYWVVITQASGTGGVLVNYATSTGEDNTSDSGWSIANKAFSRTGGTWAEAVGNNTDTPIIRMQINGSYTQHNFPAEGELAVLGVLYPGLTAYANSSEGTEGNGWDPATATYEWYLVDGATETVNTGETGRQYTVRAGDVGKRLKATASFNDNIGSPETVTGTASGVVRTAPSYAISNLGQTRDGALQTGSAATHYGHSFTTGQTDISLGGVHLPLGVADGANLRVSVYSNANSNVPDTLLFTFTNPATFDKSPNTPDGLTEFTGNFALARSTAYWLVVEQVSAGENGATLAYTTSNMSVSDPTAGWTLGGDTFVKSLGSWVAAPTDFMLFALLGRTTPTFANTTETLTIDENSAAGTVVGTITATQTGDPLTHSVAGSGVAAFNQDFVLNASTGAITVRSGGVIDHEDLSSYIVTFQVTDNLNNQGGSDPAIDDTVELTINVNNLDEPGTLTLNPATPRVNAPVTATLDDPDGGVTEQTWQWQSASTSSGTYSNITGPTAASYTPVQGDLGKFLKPESTDGQGWTGRGHWKGERK